MEGGDLLELQSAKAVENENLPLGVLQGRNRPAEPLGVLPADHSLLRRQRRVRQRQLLVGDIGVAAPTLAFLEPGVLADLAQPGIQAAAALETVDVQKGLVECLLKQLLGLVLVPRQRQEEAVDRLALGFVQLFKATHGHSSFPMIP